MGESTLLTLAHVPNCTFRPAKQGVHVTFGTCALILDLSLACTENLHLALIAHREEYLHTAQCGSHVLVLRYGHGNRGERCAGGRCVTRRDLLALRGRDQRRARACQAQTCEQTNFELSIRSKCPMPVLGLTDWDPSLFLPSPFP